MHIKRKRASISKVHSLAVWYKTSKIQSYDLCTKTNVSRMNTSTFSHFLVDEQRSIPLESVHWQSWWRENISLPWNMHGVFSTKKYVTAIPRRNCFPWSVVYEKCMCFCAWEISVNPNFSSIREKSKLGSSVTNNSSSLRCVLHPPQKTKHKEGTWHWIKWRLEDSSLSVSSTRHREPQATINLPSCGRQWHWSWKYTNKSIITARLRDKKFEKGLLK